MSQAMKRRGFLKGALAVTALAPLAACAGGSSNSSAPAKTASKTAENPFGIPSETFIAHIFNGGFGVAYAEFAADLVNKKHGSKFEVRKGQEISKELQSNFTSGKDLPAVIDNAGKGKIAQAAIMKEVEDLTDVIDSKNYEGLTIRDTLFPGALEDSMVDGKLPEIRYNITVFALWYSASLFKENGWNPPKTWDEALTLGEQAKAKGKFLFLWGNEASDYYQELLIASAIKEGGPEVRIALENLEKNAWSHPAIQAVLTKMKEIVDAGYFKPGGAGTKFTAAQAQWSNNQEALLYPSGSWIENEMNAQTKEDFQMTGTPVPTLSASPKLPFASLHASATESFIVPSKGNPAAGKEFMRAMLSKEAAANFAKTVKSLSIVKDTAPADGFGSTGLASQVKLLNEAGTDVFGWKFHDFYGMGTQHVSEWNSFLDGKRTVAEMTKNLQAISDKVADDSSVAKFKVTK